MELGPITGIRAVTLFSPEKSEASVPQNLAVDPTDRAGDDAYNTSRQTPDRGLEGEDSELVEDEVAGPAAAPSQSRPDARINYFV